MSSESYELPDTIHEDPVHFHHEELSGRVHPENIPSDAELKEKIFMTVLFDRLFDQYEEDLIDAGFTDEEIDVFEAALELYSDDDIKGVLSFPKQLRPRLFERYGHFIREGKMSVDGMVADLVRIVDLYGYTLGYHVTLRDIPEEQNGEWSIRPTELDDRDDMKMAYYSMDFEHIYRKKPAKYMYLVRAETGDKTAHRRDQNNNWGRASFLSIVAQLDLHEVDGLVAEIFSEIKNRGGNR